MELVSQVHERNLVEWARNRPNVLVLSGDLTASTEIALFKKCIPERFFSMGMAEQNMLSWAGGLAREGFIPFLHTFAVFLYRRPLDQLEMSVCYPNLPVRLVGFLPGVSTPGGVTHQAIEDIAVLRGLPNMTILEVGDATDVESTLDLTEQVPGPVYLRMMRGQIPRLFPKDQPMQLDRARVLSQGTDLAVLSTGLCTEQAMRAVAAMRRRGVAIHHLHVSTLKPFSDPQVLDAVSRVRRGVITLENHTVIGGLGSAVAEVMAENGVGRKLVRMGVQDTYCQGASFPYLMRKHGLDAQALIETAEKLLDARLDIGTDDLASVRLRTTAGASAERLEAL
jgi:transketolase